MNRKLIDESQYGVVSHAGRSAEVTEKGEFVRQNYPFKGIFGDKEGEYPVEPGRYRIFWSLGCPWSHRAVIVLKLLGLDKVISIGLVDPMRPNTVRSDWAFTLDPDGVDPVLKIHTMGEIYLETNPDFQGRFTVPAIVDIKERKVVNNNFHNMTTQLEVARNKNSLPP